MRAPQWLGAVLLAAALAGAWIDPTMGAACWLAAWWWCLGLVLGGLTQLWLHRLTGGAWGEVLRPAVLPMARRLPWLLLLALPLLAGAARLYPWMSAPAAQWSAGVARPEFLRAWLQPWAVGARLLVYASAWWWAARPARLASRHGTAAALGAYAIATSLAALDLLMSIMPGWSSTGYAMGLACGQSLAGSGFAVALVAGALPQRLLAGKPPVARDLGNLLMMWVLLWAYLAFMQLLIIWAENLPSETRWYLPRLQTGWQWGGLALALAQGAVPLVALLWRSVKDRPRRLQWVAGWVAAAGLLDAGWQVLPSVAPHDANGFWLLPLAGAGMALLLFGDLPARLRGDAPAPRTAEVLHGA